MTESEKVVVPTISGKIEGRHKDGLFVFKGIPYAAPPVGNLRWMPPAPATPWSGVRPALEFGKAAPQNPGLVGFEALHVAEPQDEDSLFLNVWTPGLDNGRRPVLVWIHGGAFNIGSGSQPLYNGRKLASRGDVVIVTINYRLGILGFLNLNGVTGGRIPATGNEGLLDQMAALRWVRDNIAAFGGDPANVTVFGESAGGMSIGCLLTMPLARGLFHKAILESGVGNTALPLEAASAVGNLVLESLGLTGADVEALRLMPVERLLAADVDARKRMAGPGEAMRPTVTAPVVDGTVLPEVPLDAILAGLAAPVPVLLGANLEEWKFFAMMAPDFPRLDETEMMKRVHAFVPAPFADELVETYRNARTGRGESTKPLDLLSAILTDLMFRIPGLQVVEALQRQGTPVYNYLFTWKSPAVGGILGACHVLEIGFVFGTKDETFCGSGREADELSLKMQDAWVAFARTGDPGCGSIGPWPPYGDRRITMILDKDCHTLEAPYKEERRVWERIPGSGTRSRGVGSLP